MRIRTLCLAGLMLTSMAGQVQGAFVSRTFNYDLNDLVSFGGTESLVGFATPVAVNPFQADVGDIIETTIIFLPGQSLTLINGNTEFWGFGQEGLTLLYQDSSDPVTSAYSETSSLTFFNGTGDLNMSGGGGLTAVGGQLFGNITNSAFTFTGFKMQSTVTQQTKPLKNYDTVFFWSAVAGDTLISNSSAVPEPASIAMWGLGVIGVVFASRKRHRLAA